jgi:hypothetical protein
MLEIVPLCRKSAKTTDEDLDTLVVDDKIGGSLCNHVLAWQKITPPSTGGVIHSNFELRVIA